jgi:hypothetical protein
LSTTTTIIITIVDQGEVGVIVAVIDYSHMERTHLPEHFFAVIGQTNTKSVKCRNCRTFDRQDIIRIWTSKKKPVIAMSARWRALFLLLPIIARAIIVTPFAATIDPATPSSTEDIEQIEFLEGVENHRYAGAKEQEEKAATAERGEIRSYIINTTGYWAAGQKLSVSVVAGGAAAAVSPEAMQAVAGGNITTTTTAAVSAGIDGGAISEWNALLSSLRAAYPSSHAPALALMTEKEKNKDDDGGGDGGTAAADIKVVLTDTDHPEGKMGKTRLYIVKSTRQILSAEITIYSADRLLKQHILEKVIEHELGHALGLSHSTNPESIMFPLLEVENDGDGGGDGGGSVINKIGPCEERGISVLYVDSKIGVITNC